MQSPAFGMGFLMDFCLLLELERHFLFPWHRMPPPPQGDTRVMDGHQAQAPCSLLGPSIILAGVIALKMERAFLLFPRAQHCWGKPSDIQRRCDHTQIYLYSLIEHLEWRSHSEPFCNAQFRKSNPIPLQIPLGRSIPSHFRSLLIILF